MKNKSLFCIFFLGILVLLGILESVDARETLTPQDFFAAVKNSYLTFDSKRAQSLIAEYSSQGKEYRKQISSIDKLVKPVGSVPMSVEQECATTIKTVDLKKHRALAESVIRRYPNCEYAWIWLGMLNDPQKIDRAAECYRKAISIAPNNLAAHIMLLGVFKTKGNKTAYLQEYRKLVSLKPDRYLKNSEVENPPE